MGAYEGDVGWGFESVEDGDEGVWGGGCVLFVGREEGEEVLSMNECKGLFGDQFDLIESTVLTIPCQITIASL